MQPNSRLHAFISVEHDVSRHQVNMPGEGVEAVAEVVGGCGGGHMKRSNAHSPYMPPSTSGSGAAAIGVVVTSAIPVAKTATQPISSMDMRRRDRQSPGAGGGDSHLTGRA